MAIKKPTPESIPEEIDIDTNPSDSDPETESDSDSDSEGGDEDIELSEPSKTAIYNKEGLLDKLNEIAFPSDIDWTHKLSLDIPQEDKIDVNDDLARELAFYNQALTGTREAFIKFEAIKLPFLRPSDYYAEMVKTDSHMEKIKGRLLSEKRRMEEAEERRKMRDNKKKAKEVQAVKNRERVKIKKDEIESVKKWRKQRQQSGFAEKDSDEMGLGLGFEAGNGNGKGKGGSERVKKGNKRQGVKPWDRTGGKGKKEESRGGGSGNGKRKSREFKDSKYGFGGKKGMKKQNTAETTNDFKGFGKRDSGHGKNGKSDSGQNKRRRT